MPPRHVYGKRSRAIYDPLAAFASPQRSSPTSLNDDDQKQVIKEPKRSTKSNLYETIAPKSSVRRKALGEINANETVQPINPLQSGSRNKRTHRRKKVVEDGDEEQHEGDNGDGRHDSKVPASDFKSKIRGSMSREATEEPELNDVNNVQLSLDGNEDDVDTKDLALPENHGATQNLKTTGIERTLGSPAPATPSISISPPTPPDFDEYSQHCASLLELSSHQLADFSEWAHDLANHFHITKIAEASFGEVYRLSLLERISGFSKNEESVFKVIALKPPDSKLPTDKRKLNAAMKKNEGMSKVTDVANEVRLLQEMSAVPGFTNFREVRIVKGRPPQPFINAFKAFNATQKAKKKELSVFLDPAKKTSYADDQLWAVIEMQDAGTDLEILVEDGGCTSIWFVWDAFWQVVLSLAKGEEAAEFEHRDLHLGNVCVRQPNHRRDEVDINPKRKLNFTGLETTIIDYTISRAIMEDSSIAYKDLAADVALFEGDSTDEYQYDIYRYMRSALFLDNALEECPETLPSAATERSWEQYHPITNLIWLHFILYKLLEQVTWPSSTKPPPRKDQTAHATWKRGNDLEHVLSRVGEILDPGSLFENEIRSASALVVHAINEGWLDNSDVVGEGKWDNENIEQALAAQFEDLGLDGGVVDKRTEGYNEPTKSRSKTKSKKKKG